MKVILLAATGGEPGKTGFPVWASPKPKHLYSYKGQIQLERIINQLLEAGFEQNNIEIVAGFQAQKIIDFLKMKNFDLKVKINSNYKKSAAWTLKTAIEGIEEDFMLICVDEILKTEFYAAMRQEHYRDKIFIKGGTGAKLLKQHIPIVKKVIEEYLDKIYISCRMFEKHEYPGSNNDIILKSAQSGIGLGYMLYYLRDLIPSYKEIAIEPNKEVPGWWIGDCDYFYQTDEYKNMNGVFQFICSRPLNSILYMLKLFKDKVERIWKIRNII